mmetsp:Transcript_11450/g.32164  ORF Transcript_11450/g.32164 Transcript_11450/m.32164 type:complete len:107 (-) Transcript_11450:666-986(-)
MPIRTTTICHNFILTLYYQCSLPPFISASQLLSNLYFGKKNSQNLNQYVINNKIYYNNRTTMCLADTPYCASTPLKKKQNMKTLNEKMTYLSLSLSLSVLGVTVEG